MKTVTRKPPRGKRKFRPNRRRLVRVIKTLPNDRCRLALASAFGIVCARARISTKHHAKARLLECAADFDEREAKILITLILGRF